MQNETSMTMIALRPIKQGEEILNDYGQLPRSDLLRRYGYVTDRYRKWDVVELSIETVTEACHHVRNLTEVEKQERVTIEVSS